MRQIIRGPLSTANSGVGHPECHTPLTPPPRLLSSPPSWLLSSLPPPAAAHSRPGQWRQVRGCRGGCRGCWYVHFLPRGTAESGQSPSRNVTMPQTGACCPRPSTVRVRGQSWARRVRGQSWTQWEAAALRGQGSEHGGDQRTSCRPLGRD